MFCYASKESCFVIYQKIVLLSIKRKTERLLFYSNIPYLLSVKTICFVIHQKKIGLLSIKRLFCYPSKESRNCFYFIQTFHYAKNLLYVLLSEIKIDFEIIDCVKLITNKIEMKVKCITFGYIYIKVS